MRTQSIDTHPKIEKTLISLFRNQSISKKLSHVRSLSKTTIQLSKRAIAKANKNISDEQINLLFINYHYGKELAEKVEKYLAERRS
jgi:vacuolar-type H+-ATPase subunit F/Vma7